MRSYASYDSFILLRALSRVAGMLFPRDARLAEVYAVECEVQAREASFGSLLSGRSTVQRVIERTPGSIRRVSPKEVLLLED